MNSEVIFTAVLTTITSLIASGTLFLVAWRKSKPEMRKTDADAQASSADAAETWAQSNQLAVQQLVELQRQLKDERLQRIELEKKITDLEIKVARQDNRIKRLEAQVVSLGAEPVK